MKRLFASVWAFTPAVAIAVACCCAPAVARGGEGEKHETTNAAAEEPLACEGTDPINNVCPISGEKVAPGAVTAIYKARVIGFSSEKAKGDWEKWDENKKGAFLLKFVKPGPINAMCPIGKEAIDLKVETLSYEGQTIGFCCPTCAAKFEAWDKAKKDEFVKAAMSAPVANTKCPLTEEAVEASSPTVVYLGTKVAFCCKGCARKWDLLTADQKGEKIKAMASAGAK